MTSPANSQREIAEVKIYFSTFKETVQLLDIEFERMYLGLVWFNDIGIANSISYAGIGFTGI